MPAPLVAALVPLLGTVLDRVLPDETARAQAGAELAKLAQSHELALLDAQLSAIIAEARSEDPFTARARPMFLYVVYVFLLAAIPMGMLFAVEPAHARAIAEGMRAWLHALPEEVWWLFGTGYLGYTGARSWDKARARAGGSRP